MASLVLSACCGGVPLRPSLAVVKPRSGHHPAPLAGTSTSGRRPISNIGRHLLRDWPLRVCTPVRPPAVPEGDGARQMYELAHRDSPPPASAAGIAFDPAAPPPFSLAELRAAIPKHCWVKDTWKSMSFVARDVAVVLGLAAAAAHIDSWLLWPLYWAAQGTMFWALFVLGHDCGHGSFSNNARLNSLVGHFLHSFILVPYHGWRISHRTHHQNHGHVERDESWHPMPEKTFKELDYITRMLRFMLPFPLLAYPLYLVVRTPGKQGSHFNPSSDLFHSNEKRDVLTSTACWSAMVLALAGLTFILGPLKMLKLYFVPYAIFVMWLDFVTYLHHHGHDVKLPWYRGKEWSYLRGGLTTLDRDYGLINKIHHDIGTHVIHHLFPQIPHYHLTEATEAAKPVLGKYYREPEKSGPFPLHLFRVLARSLNVDHYVSDSGEVVYYQTDHRLKRESSAASQT